MDKNLMSNCIHGSSLPSPQIVRAVGLSKVVGKELLGGAESVGFSFFL